MRGFVLLNIKDQCFPSYRNQLIDLQCKSIDLFLYDGEHWSLMGYFERILLLICMLWQFI